MSVDGDQCKLILKDDEVIVQKIEEKQCNNPLAGLANAVNAITNGVSGDESSNMPASVPATVNSKQAPPKAMVKPQVLTHVIEGFVIQEGINASFVCIIVCQLHFSYIRLYDVRGKLLDKSYTVHSTVKQFSYFLLNEVATLQVVQIGKPSLMCMRSNRL